jgi:hypothetical protein
MCVRASAVTVIKLIDICGVDGLILGSWRVLLVSD